MIEVITGTIELSDGTKSEFMITSDGEWHQWGADKERLGKTSSALSTMAEALLIEGILWVGPDDNEYDM